MWKFLIVAFVVIVTMSQVQSQARQGSYYQARTTNDEPRPQPLSPHAQAYANVNNGIIKSLEARIAALEDLIRENDEKQALNRDREEGLELRRIALDKLAADNESRIREREQALDKREQEITAFQNSVFKQQDEREQELERTRRGRELALDARERQVEGIESKKRY